eukprot:Seg1043.3 transcript_id=Seg1043.3/GoldUCD/mRNA.D3Y31 product="hypothetical protein" protein_id=Seg1043.3/GoldUCD/D3Y31
MDIDDDSASGGGDSDVEITKITHAIKGLESPVTVKASCSDTDDSYIDFEEDFPKIRFRSSRSTIRQLFGKTGAALFPGSLLVDDTAIRYKQNEGMIGISHAFIKSFDNDFLVPLILNAKTKYPEHVSSTQPRGISNNVCFLVDLNKLNDPRDVMCDDLGAWDQSRTSKKWYNVNRDSCGNAVSLSFARDQETSYEVVRRPFVNLSDQALKKTMVSLTDPQGQNYNIVAII